ncbi:MAG: hypothetical protein QW597_00450 [Thermoplasmataceae archaeon]
MKIEIGQRLEFEVDREDILEADSRSIIATWYHLGTPIFVELTVSKTLLAELRKLFKGNERKSALVSIARVSKTKYNIEPTMVLVNAPKKNITPLK